MKKYFKIIIEHFILLLGIGLFVFGLFSFQKYGGCFDYDRSAVILLSIGAVLIAIGILRTRKTKGEK